RHDEVGPVDVLARQRARLPVRDVDADLLEHLDDDLVQLAGGPRAGRARLAAARLVERLRDLRAARVLDADEEDLVHTLKRTFRTSPSSTTYVLPSSRCLPARETSACDPAATRSSQRTTSQRMKPRAMSVWIVAAASSAVCPRRSVHARVSFSPAVKKVIRSSVSASCRTTEPSADSPPPRNSAASSSGSSASSASSLRSMPSPPFTIEISGFVVSGSSSGGSSPASPASLLPASRWRSSCSSCSTSLRSFA